MHNEKKKKLPKIHVYMYVGLLEQNLQGIQTW